MSDARVSCRLRAVLREQYPAAVAALDSGELWASGAWGPPAAGAEEGGEWCLQTAKAPQKIQLLLVDNRPLFFRQGEDGWLFPCLRLLHCLPKLQPRCQVDQGAIKHIISGSVVMAPGICQIDPIEAGMAVTIFAEKKTYALAVGVVLRNSEDIMSDRKGPAIEVVHRLTDGLWGLTNIG